MSLADRGSSRAAIFRAALRDDVWVVTRNDVFYGDYSTRDQAIRSAGNGARAVEAKGGEARVLAAPGDQLIPHRETAPTPPEECA